MFRARDISVPRTTVNPYEIRLSVHFAYRQIPLTILYLAIKKHQRDPGNLAVAHFADRGRLHPVRLLARGRIRPPAAGHDRKLAGHRRAAAHRAVHGERPAQGLDTVPQPDKTRAPHRVGAADAVVTHP